MPSLACLPGKWSSGSFSTRLVRYLNPSNSPHVQFSCRLRGCIWGGGSRGVSEDTVGVQRGGRGGRTRLQGCRGGGSCRTRHNCHERCSDEATAAVLELLAKQVRDQGLWGSGFIGGCGEGLWRQQCVCVCVCVRRRARS